MISPTTFAVTFPCVILQFGLVARAIWLVENEKKLPNPTKLFWSDLIVLALLIAVAMEAFLIVRSIT